MGMWILLIAGLTISSVTEERVSSGITPFCRIQAAVRRKVNDKAGLSTK
jgi:hypothetical protein